MSAPSPSHRQDPNGVMMDDGFRTLVSFAAKPTAAYAEKSVQPPGLDGGEAIDTTTMFNLTWRTMAPRQLIRMTSFSMKVAYDPKFYDDAVGLINVNTTITVHFPNGGALAFYGFMQAFKPEQLEEGKQPEAEITVTPTNEDPSSHTSESPVYSASFGT